MDRIFIKNVNGFVFYYIGVSIWIEGKNQGANQWQWDRESYVYFFYYNSEIKLVFSWVLVSFKQNFKIQFFN